MATRIVELHADHASDWRDGAGELWSLSKLVQVYAETYVLIGESLQSWTTLTPEEGGSPLSPEHYRAFRACLRELQDKCEEANLQVLGKLLEGTLLSVCKTMSYRDAADKAGELSRCLHAELESKLFFFVPPHRAEYTAIWHYGRKGFQLGKELKRFEPVMERFPSANFDICEAGNAFAFESFTASVYHLMRVCEYGLVSLSRVLGIDPGTSSWDTILKKIKHTIDSNSSTKPEGWKADEEFYSEAAVQMGNVKNCWRNPISHIPRVYDEARARRIFNGVEALMLHLSNRLSETPLPRVTVLTDPDADAEGKKGDAAVG